MSDDLFLKDIYHVNSIDVKDFESSEKLGKITEKEKFLAAKQILLGLALLYILTLGVCVIRQNEAYKLIEITPIIFGQLATFIVTRYWERY